MKCCHEIFLLSLGHLIYVRGLNIQACHFLQSVKNGQIWNVFLCTFLDTFGRRCQSYCCVRQTSIGWQGTFLDIVWIWRCSLTSSLCDCPVGKKQKTSVLNWSLIFDLSRWLTYMLPAVRDVWQPTMHFICMAELKIYRRHLSVLEHLWSRAVIHRAQNWCFVFTLKLQHREKQRGILWYQVMIPCHTEFNKVLIAFIVLLAYRKDTATSSNDKVMD